MIYKNTKTGAVVKSSCVIRGNGWEPATEEQETPREGSTTQDAAEKPRAKRGKK